MYIAVRNIYIVLPLGERVTQVYIRLGIKEENYLLSFVVHCRWLTMRASGLCKACYSYLQRFSLRTSREREGSNWFIWKMAVG